MYIKTYKELVVWQKAIKLVKEIYSLTKNFPKDEQYGLVLQMRRASISIASNIAEGYGRNSVKEYTQFYSICYGSALELETQLIISKELIYLDERQFEVIHSLLEEVIKMLRTMIYKLKEKS